MRIISDEEFKEVFVAENIMGRLINKNVDREWLSGIPHRTFLDMYIIYQVDISVLFNQPDYIQTVIIDNDVANMMSVREDNLYLAALMNGNRDAYVANIKEFIGLGDEVYDPLEDDLLIITNRNNRFGAFSICHQSCMPAEICLAPSLAIHIGTVKPHAFRFPFFNERH